MSLDGVKCSVCGAWLDYSLLDGDEDNSVVCCQPCPTCIKDALEELLARIEHKLLTAVDPAILE